MYPLQWAIIKQQQKGLQCVYYLPTYTHTLLLSGGCSFLRVLRRKGKFPESALSSQQPFYRHSVQVALFNTWLREEVVQPLWRNSELLHSYCTQASVSPNSFRVLLFGSFSLNLKKSPFPPWLLVLDLLHLSGFNQSCIWDIFSEFCQFHRCPQLPLHICSEKCWAKLTIHKAYICMTQCASN